MYKLHSLLGKESRAVPISVSYTHLRAHETGRNLVCRLLLEKKKERKEEKKRKENKEESTRKEKIT